LGNSISKVGVRVQTGIGWAMTGVGVAIFATPLLGAPKEMMFAAIGPLIAGIVNVGVAGAVRRRYVDAAPTVELSSDARALLRHIYRERIGWPTAMAYGAVATAGLRAHARRFARFGGMPPMGEQYSPWSATGYSGIGLHHFGRTLPKLTPEVWDALDRAAHAYNRVAAVQAISRDQGGIGRITGRIDSAADEAMGEILHNSATLCRYPEGADAGRSRIENRILALEELARRLESLTSPTAADMRGTRRAVDEVLDDLRLEQLARSELRLDDVDPTQRLDH